MAMPIAIFKRKTLPEVRQYLSSTINPDGDNNSEVDLVFSSKPFSPTADYETGLVLECREPSGTWETLNPAGYGAALSDANIRVTLTGTVDTFQASHEFRASYDGSGDLNIAVGAAVATVINNSSVDLLTGGIVSYALGEATSAVRVDPINAYNLTDNNDVAQQTYTGPPELSPGAVFDGVDQDLTVGDNADLRGGNIFLYFTGWAWLDSEAATQVIMGKWLAASSKREYCFLYNVTHDRIKFAVSADGASGVTTPATTEAPSAAVVADTWYHLIGEHDPDDDAISLFVDNGAEIQTTHTTGINGDDADFSLGSGAGAAYVAGRLDGVYLAKPGRKWTAAERADLYNGGDGKQWPFIPDHL